MQQSAMKCQRQQTARWFVTILGALLIVMFCLHSSPEESALHWTQKLTEETGEAGTPAKCDGDTREKFVTETCQREGWTNKSVLQRHTSFGRFMFHDDLKIIYCSMAKTGSTLIRTLIGRAVLGRELQPERSGLLNTYLNEVVGVKTLNTLPLPEIQWRLDTYHKVVSVRHPMERLYSAYVDKMGAAIAAGIDCTKYKSFKRGSKKYYCQGFRQVFGRDVQNASDLNFPSFLRLITLDTELANNPHWSNYMPSCFPCEVHYDHIIKPETMEEDMELFLPKIGMPVTKSQKKQQMHVHNDVNPQDKMRTLSELYQGVPDDVMRDVEEKYGRDAEVFGYSWDSAKREARCNIVDQSSPNKVCC